MSYTEVTISGYNSSPPPDDGSTGPTNQVKWSSIKSKLFDPLRTALELIDDRVATAVTAADSTLSTLQSGVTSANSNVTALATALTAPSGTVMLFVQTSAPTGWSKGATYDDYALRAVTGTASTGGSTAFTSVFTARTISVSNLPSHAHNFSAGPTAITFGGTTFVYDISDNTSGILGGGGQSPLDEVNNNNSTLAGTVSVSGTTGAYGSGSTWDFAVQYVDVILATKS